MTTLPTVCQRRHSTCDSSGGPTTSTRRRLLLALGSGITVAVAGCSGLRGEPRYEAGDVGDVDGEDRSAEELVAANALAEQDVHDGVTPLETLSLAEHEFVLEDGYQGATVQGVVENESDDRVDLAEVRVRAYDDAGDQLGRYVDRTGDLGAGDRWAFTVVLLESPGDLAEYDVAVLGTPS